jgi:hypothetical protein
MLRLEGATKSLSKCFIVEITALKCYDKENE